MSQPIEFYDFDRALHRYRAAARMAWSIVVLMAVCLVTLVVSGHLAVAIGAGFSLGVAWDRALDAQRIYRSAQETCIALRDQAMPKYEIKINLAGIINRDVQ